MIFLSYIPCTHEVVHGASSPSGRGSHSIGMISPSATPETVAVCGCSGARRGWPPDWCEAGQPYLNQALLG
jgi:hypothetical protein